MARAFFEFGYDLPLAEPLATDAFLAPDADAQWLLFIFPGTPANKLLFARLLRVAPPGFEVVVVSRPGFGKGHERAFTNFDDQLAAIKPFLPGGAEYSGKKIIALGVSYGGELALKAALDFPDTVKGAVTVAALIDEPHDYALTLEKLGGDPGIEPYVPNRWKKVREEVTGRRAQIGPLLERLQTYHGPVEVLHGDFDAIVPRANADRLMEVLPNAGLDIVPGGTHYLELQYPRRVLAAAERVAKRAGG